MDSIAGIYIDKAVALDSTERGKIDLLKEWQWDLKSEEI